MAFKSIQASAKQSLLDYFVSGKAVQYHSAEKGYRLELLGLTATGGVISDYIDGSDVYRAHIFTSSGTFDVTAPGTFGDTVDILTVAGGGGGGGGQYHGGGGGAGGLLEGSITVPAVPTSYTVTIGAGAAGGVNAASGGTGGNTTFLDPRGPTTYTASGGGGGAYAPDGYGGITGGSGGSGGGAAGVSQPSAPVVSAFGPGTQANQPGPNGTLTGYGNPGGGPAVFPNSPNYTGGGGGGAGAAGYPGNNPEPAPTRGDGGARRANVYVYGPTNPVN